MIVPVYGVPGPSGLGAAAAQSAALDPGTANNV